MTDSMDNRALRQAASYADQWLQYRREYRDHPGLVAAIQKDGELLLNAAYGFANLEQQVAMQTSHLFRIASHSKTFTATAIMQLVEQNRLRLDDRLQQHLPWLSAEATVRQTLNHASGITRDSADADFWDIQLDFPDRDQLRAMATQGKIFEPNTSFKYSNIGYGLLGLVVEAVSGATYNDYVREHIVKRLGLQNTGPEVSEAPSDRLVTGYTRSRLGVPRRALPLAIDTHALSPATGFYSTAEDLCRYAAAHCMGDTRLLNDASKREMQQPYWSVEHADEHYGLGFSVREIGKRHLVGHGGGFPGQSTRTLIDAQDHHLVVVVLSNTNASDGLAGPLAESVVKIIDFAQSKSSADSAADLRAYTGRFANAWGVLDVVQFGDTLIATSPEADNPVERISELEVVDASSLRIRKTGGYGSQGELVRYERDADGSVNRMVWGGMSSYPVEVFQARNTEPVVAHA